MEQGTIQRSEKFYRLLVSLYPRKFQAQFGDEMLLVFAELLQDAQAQAGSMGVARLWARTMVDLCRSLPQEYVREQKGCNVVNSGSVVSPTWVAVIGFLLCLPGAIMFTLLTLNIEPPFASLKPPVPVDQPDVIGTAIALSLIVLLPIVAFVINLVPIRRAMRAGGNLAALPLNVALVVAVLLIIAAFVGAIIVDQYPCWIGVPNCD